jgi:hypothetical protein
LSVTKETAFYFRLSHSFHGIEPQQLNQFMIPVFIRQPVPTKPEELAKMDVLSQKVGFSDLNLYGKIFRCARI